MTGNRFYLFKDPDYNDYIFYRAKYVKGKKFVEPLTVIRKVKQKELIKFLDANVEEVKLKLESGKRLEVLAINYHKLYDFEITSPRNIFRIMKKKLVFTHKVNGVPYLTYAQAVRVLSYMEYVLSTYPELTDDHIGQITRHINRKINV